MSEFPPRGTLSVSYGEVCDRGKVRDENQDSVRSAAIPLGDLFVVADGIGGYQGGATASRMVVEGFLSQMAARPAGYPPDHAMAEACAYTNSSIYAAANTGDPAFQRMGSTVVLALIQDGAASGGNSGEVASFGPTAWIGHVGDSRAYLIRGGQMVKITNDHSAVQALINRNLITEEEARNHPDASVLTRSLGHRPEVEIEIDRVPLQAGDALLLCSDGLWGYVADADISAVATDPTLSVDKIAAYLLDLALTAGGHDNIGIEYIRIGGEAPAAFPVAPPARSATRATQPEIDASHFARPSGAFQPPSPSSSSTPPSTSKSSHRNQLLLAVVLLALALGGGLAIALHYLSNNKNGGEHTIVGPVPASPSGPASGTTPAPRQHDESRHPQKPNAPTPEPAGVPAVPPPNPNEPRLIGVVGELELGPFKPPATEEIEFKDTKIQMESKAECKKLATEETVVYVSKSDQNERKIIEWIVNRYPDAKEQMNKAKPRKQLMSPAIKTACGVDYDAIVMLAAKPSPAGPQTNGGPAVDPQGPSPDNRSTNQLRRRPHPASPQH